MRMLLFFSSRRRHTRLQVDWSSDVCSSDLLPLGLRSIQKLENIVRQEMTRAGSTELLMPAIQPAELWMESGRWQKYGRSEERRVGKEWSCTVSDNVDEEKASDRVIRE